VTVRKSIDFEGVWAKFATEEVPRQATRSLRRAETVASARSRTYRRPTAHWQPKGAPDAAMEVSFKDCSESEDRSRRPLSYAV